jgi:ADP-dependent NAD(P)H-hydrate dehydratase / NAD(P)H-hydrate epimerase
MTNEIITPEQMYEVDRAAVASGQISFNQLMENAGRAVVDEIQNRFKPCETAVLCGPGNNGGDGFVVARLLEASGWPVAVYIWGDRDKLQGDAGLMAAEWTGTCTPIENLQSAGLVVDALFGAGLSREFPQSIVDRIARTKAPVVSIDVPSGLDGLSASPRGTSLRADVTVTFCRKKPAHVLYPGRWLCGEIVLRQIAMPDEALASVLQNCNLFENTETVLPSLPVDAHKYSRGGAVFMSGAEFSTGASRLAAMAAARSGAGAVTICGSPAALRIHAAHVTSIMLKSNIDFDDRKWKSACIGPGATVGAATRKQVVDVLKQENVALVIDASALMSFENNPSELFRAIQKSRSPAVVLTPHQGEFTRLFKDIARSTEPKHEKARAAAKQSGAIVVYKGPDTVIAHPDGRAAINTNGTAKLATAGSGDVLAGMITGLLAQGINGFESACAAVWLHADAATKSTRKNPIAEDFLDYL